MRHLPEPHLLLPRGGGQTIIEGDRRDRRFLERVPKMQATGKLDGVAGTERMALKQCLCTRYYPSRGRSAWQGRWRRNTASAAVVAVLDHRRRQLTTARFDWAERGEALPRGPHDHTPGLQLSERRVDARLSPNWTQLGDGLAAIGHDQTVPLPDPAKAAAQSHLQCPRANQVSCHVVICDYFNRLLQDLPFVISRSMVLNSLTELRFRPRTLSVRVPYVYGTISRMKKTLHIDERLLRDAKSAAGASTDTETVRLGLEALIRRRAYERLRALRGSEPNARDVPRRRDRSSSPRHSAA